MNRNQGALQDQEEALIDYMERHSGLATSKFLGINGVEQRKEQWDRVPNLLNALGPLKTAKSWMRYWTDLKRKCREYNARKWDIIRKTSDEAVDFEEDLKFERMLNILGRSHGNGLCLIPEIGVTLETAVKTKRTTRKTSGATNTQRKFRLKAYGNNNLDLLAAHALQYSVVRENQVLTQEQLEKINHSNMYKKLKEDNTMERKENEIIRVLQTISSDLKKINNKRSI